MSKVTYNPIIESAHGKLHSESDMWLMERNGTQFTGHRNNPRDYSLKPQSEAEKECTLRLGAASKAYNQLEKGSPEWIALENAWREQKDKPGGKPSIRGYFISQHMKGGA